jgi:hypothetical protein
MSDNCQMLALSVATLIWILPPPEIDLNHELSNLQPSEHQCCGYHQLRLVNVRRSFEYRIAACAMNWGIVFVLEILKQDLVNLQVTHEREDSR